jgi:hypothetical protein
LFPDCRHYLIACFVQSTKSIYEVSGKNLWGQSTNKYQESANQIRNALKEGGVSQERRSDEKYYSLLGFKELCLVDPWIDSLSKLLVAVVHRLLMNV